MKAKINKNEPEIVRNLRKKIEDDLEFCREKRTTSTYDHNNAKDVLRLKSKINSYCATMDELFKDDYGPPEGYSPENRSSVIMNRRKEAVLQLSKEAAERFRSKYPNVDIEETFLKLCLIPCCDHIDGIGTGNNVLLAAVKWMLDELRRAGRLEDALPLIMDCGEKLSYKDMIPDVHFPDYNDTVVCNLAYLVCCRNIDKAQSKAVGRIIDEGAALHRPILEQETLTRPISEMTYRERFDAVMKMIPHRTKRLAEKHFEELIWKQFALCLQGINKYRGKELEIIDKIITAIEANKRCMNEILELCDRKCQRDTVFKKHIMQMHDVSSIFDDLNDNEMHNRGDIEVFEDKREKLEKLGKEIDDLFGKAEETEQAQNFIIAYPMWNIAYYLGYRLDKATMDMINSIRILDPYEICFAALSFVDQNSDLAWLYNFPLVILKKVVMNLPWAVNRGYGEYFKKHYKLSKKTDKTMHTQLFSAPLDVVKIIDYNSEITMNIAQMIYSMTGIVVPRNIRGINDIKSTLMKNGVPAEEAALWESYVALCCALGINKQEAVIATEKSKAIADEDERKQILIKNLENEKEKLKIKLSELEERVGSCYAKLREQGQRLKETEEALAKERETVNNLRNQADRQSDAVAVDEKCNIDYPYTPKNRVLIVGGDVGWVNSMKKYIQGVVYIDTDQKIKPNDITSCDLLWLQANIMSHKMYKAVIDVARRNNKRVMYFTCLGAKMCADQVVKEDMNNQ